MLLRNIFYLDGQRQMIPKLDLRICVGGILSYFTFTLTIFRINTKLYKQANCRDKDNNSLGTFVLLGHYAASSSKSLPTFRNNLSVPSSTVKNKKGCETGYGVYKGRVLGMISVSSGVGANRVDAGGRRDREVQSSVLLCCKTYWEWRICNRCRREREKGNCLYEQRERRGKKRERQ